MKKIWDFLNGKKTILGLIGHAIWLTANLVFPDLASGEQSAYGHLIIGSVTGVGIGSKMEKWNIEQKQKKK
jgi:hypothetical protein